MDGQTDKRVHCLMPPTERSYNNHLVIEPNKFDCHNVIMVLKTITNNVW